METAQSLITIDCLTDLTVSILNGCFFINRLSKERSITGCNFPFFFGIFFFFFFFFFLLRFYGPVNPMGSCRARSVYLTTRLLGRLSPLSG